MPHTVRVDRDSGLVWSTMYDAPNNSFMRFDPATESFEEFLKISVPKSLPHTGAILPDGPYLITLARREAGPVKLVIASPDGTLEDIEYPGKPQGPRVAALDPSDSNIVWIVANDETWRYDVRSKEFTAFVNPLPERFPKGSYAGIYAEPGAKPTNRDGYALTVDSKGMPWVSQLELGLVLKLDPASGEWTTYHHPEMQSARGIEADAHDNIWFADFYGRQLGVVDGATGEIRFYKPPTEYGSPYGITIDRQNDYVWYGDTHANYATRFDPKTGEFDEYPLGSPNASVRFMDIDAQGRIWYGGYWNEWLGVLDPGDRPRDLVSSR
jgi:streptogramin lyase